MEKQVDRQIPISLVAHFEFCPRRAWLEAAGERSSVGQLEVGIREHRNVDDPSTARSGSYRAVDVFHDQWGVTGRLDVLDDGEDGVVLREYKATPIRRSVAVTLPMRTQLALQAACLDRMGISVQRTEVYFTTHNRMVVVDLGDEDFDRARTVAEQTRSCVLSDVAPEPLIDSPKCARCSHAGVCLPDERRLTSSARRIMVADPDSQVVYLSTPGARASIARGRMVVEKSGEQLASVPLEKIQALEVHGNVDLSSGLIRELMWKAVPIVWCSGAGRMMGWARSTWGPNGLVRVQQHVAAAEGRLALSREFIASKISNQATQLRRAGAPVDVITNLRRTQREVADAQRWQDVIGKEGEAAALYFSNWPYLIKERLRDTWSWSGRSGRPATDPINALLNYAYMMLTSEAVKAVTAAGLDPHAGFLHSSARNKPALALDLMEEFRAPVADSVVQTVINNGEVSPNAFTDVFGTFRMEDSARRSLIAAFERRMLTEFTHPVFGYSVTWRRALEIQARQILGYLDGSQDRYQGIRVR